MARGVFSTTGRRTAVTALAFAVALSAATLRAQDIYRTDGRVYKNVDNYSKIDDYFTFDKDGRSYSIPEWAVRKIVKNGKTIYEKLDLMAERVRPPGATDNTPFSYKFTRNGEYVGEGTWVAAGEFRVTRGNIPDGVYKAYFDSGELRRTFSFKNGALNGMCMALFRSGQTERKGTFKNGKEEGRSELYYPNGTRRGVSIYKNGLKNGTTTLYYPSGKIKAKLFFKDSNPDGKQVMYYENGKVESEVIYVDGKKKRPR
jgi:antitoxin component YwqK of YwqJK toxin-antitoxin module